MPLSGTKSPSLCLGTAAFGMDYGITNSAGKVAPHIVQQMIKFAIENNIYQFDTALAYGDSCFQIGESRLLYPDIQVMSKFPSQSSLLYCETSVDGWETTFQNMLATLKLSRLDTLLLHDAADSRKIWSKVLFRWLDSLKERRLVSRIGVSIYTENCLKNVPLDLIDVVQLPISLYDQRLLNTGMIESLLGKNIKLHGRSFYLQGLLLQPPSKWPLWIPQKFILHHRRLQKHLEMNQSSFIEIALEFARSLSFLEYAIFGVCNISQLNELISHWNSPRKYSSNELSKWSINDNSFLDPRLWPK